MCILCPKKTAFVIPSLSLHLCPSLTSPPSLHFSHFCTPIKCFVCCDFPCGYLSGDSMPRPGTGPQFPRQLYNCFGHVPNATGYRGIIDVKRNMYETRRCGGVHMVPYTAMQSHLTVVQWEFCDAAEWIPHVPHDIS